MSRPVKSIIQTWQRAAMRLFQPERSFFSFIFGTIALTFFAEVSLRVLLGETSVSRERLLFVAAISLLVFTIALTWMRWSLTRLMGASERLSNKQQPDPHRGLVFMLGYGGPPTCEEAFLHHQSRLEVLWLICSSQTLQMATTLTEKFQALSPSLKVPEPIIVNDVNDPDEFYRIIKRIYRDRPPQLRPDDIICDYVGMTAHGSVGMALACRKYGWPMEYTPGIYDESLKAIRPLSPILILRSRRRQDGGAQQTDQEAQS